MTIAFKPTGPTLTVAATSTSTAAQSLGFDDVNEGPGPRQIRVVNTMTAGILYLKFGNSAVGVATTTVSATLIGEVPMNFGATETFTLTADMTHVRVITSTGSASVYITPGKGL